MGSPNRGRRIPRLGLVAVSLALLAACPTNRAVTGLSLSATSLDLVPGDGAVLKAAVSPANAANASVSFSSDNAAVATVSSVGAVTCLAKGRARITAATAEGGFTATCDVTVEDFPATRKFVSANFKTSAYYYVNATLLAQGGHSAVYVQTSKLSSVSAASAQAVCDEFDTNVHGLMNSTFGTESDVDGNGKLIFLIQDILDTYSGPGTGYVAGYFNPENELSRQTDSYSNQADMLYLDMSPATVGSPDFYATIAHEFQHLINCAHTYLVDGTEQDTWINEGLSSGAEYCYAEARSPGHGQIQDRIDYYNADATGSIGAGNTCFVWNGYFERSDTYDDVLADYATVYLFFQWLQLQSDTHTAIYKDILDSSYRDYQAVLAAARAHFSGYSSASWGTVLSDWFLANAIQNSSGLHGYHGGITGLTIHAYNGSSTAWSHFEPGSGAYSTLASAYTPGTSGTNMNYIGFNPLTFVIDNTGPDYSGTYLLTYNANPLIAGSAETGYLAQYASSSASSAASASAGAAASAVAAASASLKATAFRMDAAIHPDGSLGAARDSGSGTASRALISRPAKLEEQ